MKKLTSLFLLWVFAFQFLASAPLWAKDKKDMPPEPPESQESPEGLQLSPKDADFAERSEVATKFTFKEIPRDLGGDLKTSFWGWGALGFGVGIGLTAGLHPLDDNLTNSFQKDALFTHTGNEIISWTLSPYTIAGASAITWMVGAGTHHP